MSTISVDNFEDRTTEVSVGAEYVTLGTAKAYTFITYSGGTPSSNNSLNVSSLTDNSTGSNNMNLTNNMSSTNYSPIAGNNEGVAHDVYANQEASASYYVTITYNTSSTAVDFKVSSQLNGLLA